MQIRLTAVVAAALLGVAACSSTSPDVASAPPINTPVPGAIVTYGEGGLNSDNQPAIRRSGLNSDPTNPAGVAGRQIGSEYET